MNNYYKFVIILLFIALTVGCKKICPKGYSHYNNTCYTYENIDPEINYYCNKGGTLNGTHCIIEKTYNCSMISDKEICNSTSEYLAAKEYICPDDYDLNGNKCSKIKYLK